MKLGLALVVLAAGCGPPRSALHVEVTGDLLAIDDLVVVVRNGADLAAPLTVGDGQPFDLPFDFSLVFPGDRSGRVDLDVTARRGGVAVAHGLGSGAIAPGESAEATVALSSLRPPDLGADGPSDGGAPLDLAVAPADLATPDLVAADRVEPDADSGDLATERAPDAAPDLAPMFDLAAPPDAVVAPDLAVSPPDDLTVPPPDDLAVPPPDDLASAPPDLAIPDLATLPDDLAALLPDILVADGDAFDAGTD